MKEQITHNFNPLTVSVTYVHISLASLLWTQILYLIVISEYEL